MTVIERRAPKTTVEAERTTGRALLLDRGIATTMDSSGRVTDVKMQTAPFAAIRRPNELANGKKEAQSKTGDATDNIIIW